MSKTGQPTPGPWIVDRTIRNTSVGRNNVSVIARQFKPGEAIQIGEWHDYEWDGPCPNARLIAAAPDLLAALEKLLAHVTNYTAGLDEAAQFKAAKDDARAAIRRAKAGA